MKRIGSQIARIPCVLLLLVVGAGLLAACDAAVGQAAAQPSAADNPSPAMEDDSYLLFNQRMVESSRQSGFDVEDVDAVFTRVFLGLPDEVIVYPSENYYYFILYAGQRQIWGNIRLPAGARDDGELSFGYFEFVEFARQSGEGLSGSKFYNAEDGVLVEGIDAFTYSVTYADKEVIFHLHELDQSPPTSFRLGADEIFVERTLDESGYPFFLLYNTRDNYFFWVLNEEEPQADVLDSLAEDLMVGKRSGFGFWVDGAHDDRKVLMAVRKLSVTRNDYYDGPFDQLADNYAAEQNVSEYMQRAYPALRDRIDTYGYYTDRERPMRVALSTYFNYFAQADLLTLAAQVRASDDPYALISRRGAAAPVASPTPTPEEE